MSRPTPFQKGHVLLAGMALFLSLLLVLIGWMLNVGMIDEFQWDMLFGRNTMPEGIGGTVLGVGLLSLPVTLIWYLVARFIEPSGEQCNYQHNLTTIGGLLSRDFTGGYGPEEYVLNRAMPGSYRIKAHFFGSNQQDLTGATTLQLTIITNFGRTDEHRESITVRLDKPNAIVDVGTVEIGRTAEED